MMKQFLLSFVLTSGFAASLAVPAFAQDNPNTVQTDQSEEDWRKSKKKTTTDDPWNGFKNTNGWGQGTQRSMSPVDMLPEDSRRFLMKERAERLAEAGVGEPIDTSFEPSDEAKSDPSLESDEKAAWSEMMKDMGGMPSAGDPTGDPSAQGGAPQIPTQVGEYGGSSGSAGSPPSSIMRGGSSASVSDILAQIKGGGAAPSAQTQGQGSQGQSQQGQAPQGQAPTAAQMQAQAQAQGQAQSQSQNQSQADAQNAADGQAQADAQSSADGSAQAQDAADAQAARTPEAISPLDRLKQTREERESTGRRSSASDYLKRGN